MVLRWQKNVEACARYWTFLVRKIYHIARHVYPSVSSGQTMKGCRDMIGQVKLYIGAFLNTFYAKRF